MTFSPRHARNGKAERRHVGVGPDAGVSEQIPRAAGRLPALEDGVAQRRVLFVDAKGRIDAGDAPRRRSRTSKCSGGGAGSVAAATVAVRDIVFKERSLSERWPVHRIVASDNACCQLGARSPAQRRHQSASAMSAAAASTTASRSSRYPPSIQASVICRTPPTMPRRSNRSREARPTRSGSRIATNSSAKRSVIRSNSTSPRRADAAKLERENARLRRLSHLRAVIGSQHAPRRLVRIGRRGIAHRHQILVHLKGQL